MAKKIILLFVFVLMFSFISAVPPFQTSILPNTGIQVEAPIIETHKLGEDFKFYAHLFNVSNGLPISIVDNSMCDIHIYSPDGNHIIETQMDLDSNGWDMEYLVKGGNFSEAGQYAVIIFCIEVSGIGGFIEYPFMINGVGAELGEGTAVLIVGLLVLLVGLFLLTMFGYFRIPDHKRTDEGLVLDVSKLLPFKPILLGLSWVLLTAIMFIASNVAVGYLTTGLLGAFLFATWRIMALSNVVIIPLVIIFMIQKIALSKDMMGMIERGVDFT